jgi:hypothetical protein
MSTEQTVKDLNLDEMFEVFDEADKKIPASAIPVGQPGSIFDPKKTTGSSAPFGFFDPAGLTIDISEDQYKLFQEAEIKHGRVAMAAFLGIIFGEHFGFLFGNYITGPAIYQFQQADALIPDFWLTVSWLIAVAEGQTIVSGWQSLDETMKESLGFAKLAKTYTPGELGFDPLKLAPKNAKDFAVMKTKEINNGRLAMIAVLGIVVQELITNEKIF